MSLRKNLGPGSKATMYVSAQHDRSSFQEYPNEYWLPTFGRAAFHPNAAAAKDEAIELAALSHSTAASIPLYWVALHTKTSYYKHYEKMRAPATISFARPALVLHEHEAEDPRTRDGAGFTVFPAAVCLEKSMRDRIGDELRLRPEGRWIVAGFQLQPFELPRSRTIAPNSIFDRRLWVFETDSVELAVF